MWECNFVCWVKKNIIKCNYQNKFDFQEVRENALCVGLLETNKKIVGGLLLASNIQNLTLWQRSQHVHCNADNKFN